MRRSLWVLHVVRLVDDDEIETCLALRERLDKALPLTSDTKRWPSRSVREIAVGDDRNGPPRIENLEVLVEPLEELCLPFASQCRRADHEHATERDSGGELEHDDSGLDRLPEANFVGDEHPAVGRIEELEDGLELVWLQIGPRGKVGVEVLLQRPTQFQSRQGLTELGRLQKIPSRSFPTIESSSTFAVRKRSAYRVLAPVVMKSS